MRTKSGSYETTYTPNVVTELSEGEFELTIDVERLLRRLAWTASLNKGGRSGIGGGAVVVKRVRAKVVDRKVETRPLPDSYELIEPAVQS